MMICLFCGNSFEQTTAGEKHCDCRNEIGYSVGSIDQFENGRLIIYCNIDKKEEIKKLLEEAPYLKTERDDLKNRLVKMCANQQNIGRCKYNKAKCKEAGCSAAMEPITNMVEKTMNESAVK